MLYRIKILREVYMRKYPLIIVFFIIVLLSCSTSTERGDDYAERGIEHFNRGEYQRASDDLEISLELGVNTYAPELIHTLLGNAYSELGEYDKALQEHQKAVKINPIFHKAWVNMGIVYRLTGEYERAESCYMKAIEIEPDYPELYISLGALYIFKDEPERAVEFLKRAIELDRQNAIAFANIALAYALCRDFDKADIALEKAIILGYERSEQLRQRIEELKKL